MVPLVARLAVPPVMVAKQERVLGVSVGVKAVVSARVADATLRHAMMPVVGATIGLGHRVARAPKAADLYA